MKPSSVVAAVLLAPLALALTAFFSGLWQRPKGSTNWREEELGI